jgi:molecular chaperone DnaK (HSP70)
VCSEIFGKAPHKGVNPDEVVAQPAARDPRAAVLKGEVADVLLLRRDAPLVARRRDARRCHPRA